MLYFSDLAVQNLFIYFVFHLFIFVPRMMADAAMAVVKNVTKKVDVLKIDVSKL